MGQKEQLLNNIGVISFTLIELGLYLDTHPHDRNALDYYNHYVKIKKQLCQEFSKKYYPLVLDEAENNNVWSWGEAPLPWEGEC